MLTLHKAHQECETSKVLSLRENQVFKAILIEKKQGAQSTQLQQLKREQLPQEDVLVRVAYSTLNYKDALAVTGKSPVVRQFPMIPGIDFSGVVEHSSHLDFQPGDRVLVNGWGIGESYWGGLAEYVSVPAHFLIPVPETFNLRDTMLIGTAGHTAMLCVLALEQQGVTPDKGPVLVTGAAGGVGSIAVAVLAKLGYEVTALTGRMHEADYLKRLGASALLDRVEYSKPARPLMKEQWAAAIDVAGGHTLANVCASMRYYGVVAACGLAESMSFPGSVAPFILRAIRLIGVESVYASREKRLCAWRRLATDLEPAVLQSMLAQEIRLDQVTQASEQLLAGRVRGRVVVAIQPQL